MKRFILFTLILIQAFSFSISAKAATWRFKWENTTINIPVGEELGNYIDKPVARLYRDDVALTDARIDYSRDGDWLYFLKDVNTNRVGEYKVWYKAFENEQYNPGTCHGYKQIITFIVEDTINPTLLVKSQEITKKRQLQDVSSEDLYSFLLANVEAKDNYSECKITFNHDIDLTKIGRYKVEAFATDSSKNIGKGSFYVNVIEGSAPTITYLGDGNVLNLPIGSSYNVKELFKAFDEVDGDITDFISIPTIDTSRVGSEEYIISVYNKAGQEASFNLMVNIIDDEAPVIVLLEERIILPYQTDFTSYDFMKHVKEIIDNKEVDYNKVKVSHSIKNIVGTYNVEYEYSDGVNSTKAILEVTLITDTKPIIDVSDIKIKKGERIDFKELITIIDESDPLIMETLDVDDSKVDYDTPGEYIAEAFCINSTGISATKQFKVIIEDAKASSSNKDGLGGIDGAIWIMVSMLVIILGMGGFIAYYFVIRKKRNSL